MEQAGRPTVENHVHRATRLGAQVLINESWYKGTTFHAFSHHLFERLHLSAQAFNPPLQARCFGLGGVTAEVGDGLEVGREAADQPHQTPAQDAGSVGCD